MKQELQQKLFAKYPKIFNTKELDPREPFPMFGIECGNGWYFLLDKLCGCIQSYTDNNCKFNHIPQVIATQVKEKFGTLRFYYNGGDDNIHGMVWLAEYLSGHTCEHCGSIENVTQNEHGWILTLCDNCRKENEKEDGTINFSDDGLNDEGEGWKGGK